MKKREFSFMYQPKYKEIIRDAQKGLKHLKNLIDFDSKEERINQTRNDLRAIAAKSIQDFVKAERQRITEQKQSIEQSYAKARNVYKNPTEELLRRQDFDMEVSAMDNTEIAKLIQTPGRTFTMYELNKLHSLNLDSESKARVKSAINKNKNPHLEDVKYQQLQKEAAELALIDAKSVQNAMLYIPSNSPQGYKSVGLNSLFMIQDANDFNKKTEMLSQCLSIDPENVTKTFSSENVYDRDLNKLLEKPQNKYEDFDTRIFKASKNYDVTDRFKYLKERFDDKETDRFDVTKDGYDIIQHLDYLEGQHVKKMQSDASYRESYQKAEAAVIRQENGGEQQ